MKHHLLPVSPANVQWGYFSKKAKPALTLKSGERVTLMIDNGVRVASFAQAPSPELVSRCRSAGLVVMPTIGAPRHAVKVAEWGVDAVIAQGGEGGGHTGWFRPRC